MRIGRNIIPFVHSGASDALLIQFPVQLGSVTEKQPGAGPSSQAWKHTVSAFKTFHMVVVSCIALRVHLFIMPIGP